MIWGFSFEIKVQEEEVDPVCGQSNNLKFFRVSGIPQSFPSIFRSRATV